MEYGQALNGYGTCENRSHRPYPHGIQDDCRRWRLAPYYADWTAHLLDSIGSGYRLSCGHIVAYGGLCAWDRTKATSTCWRCAEVRYPW